MDSREARTARRWAVHQVDWSELDEATRMLLLSGDTPRPLGSAVPKIPGHAIRFTNSVAWCSCGSYMGGLGAFPESDGEVMDRYELHRAVILARQAQTAREESLFS